MSQLIGNLLVGQSGGPTAVINASVCGVVQEAMRQGLGPLPILRLMPYLLPESLRYAVPATVLFAACSV